MLVKTMDLKLERCHAKLSAREVAEFVEKYIRIDSTCEIDRETVRLISQPMNRLVAILAIRERDNSVV